MKICVCVYIKVCRYIYIYVYTGNTKGGSITVPLTSCLTGLESAVWQLTIFCFYLQNRLIPTSQRGGQRYSDTSPFSIPWYIYIHIDMCSMTLYMLDSYWCTAGESALKPYGLSFLDPHFYSQLHNLTFLSTKTLFHFYLRFLNHLQTTPMPQ
jgi:hypothetical protein